MMSHVRDTISLIHNFSIEFDGIDIPADIIKELVEVVFRFGSQNSEVAVDVVGFGHLAPHVLATRIATAAR